MPEYSTCPDPETLAALVDGRLSTEARRAIVVHLDGCELCYDTVVETTRFQGDEEPRGRLLGRGRFVRPRDWWLGVAAAAALVAAALLVLSVSRDEPERSVVASLPDGRAGSSLVAFVSPKTLSAVEENLWPAWPDEEPSMGFALPARGAIDFRLGVRLADLRLAAAAEDDAAYETALGHFERSLQPADLRSALAEEVVRARESEAAEDRAEAVEALMRALADHTEPEALNLGLWAETSRVAAVANDYEFFGSPAFSRTLSHLPPDEVPDDLASLLETNRDNRDPSAMNDLERFFRRIILDSGGSDR